MQVGAQLTGDPMGSKTQAGYSISCIPVVMITRP